MASALGACRPLACHSKPLHVVIVGAGMAGLAAAQYLKQHNTHVTILEGRHRVGGRIWTPNWKGTPVDLGAMFLHGTQHNPLTPLVSAYQTPQKVDYYATSLFDPQGKLVSPQDTQKAIRLFREGLKQMPTLQPDTPPETSLQEAFLWWLKTQPQNATTERVKAWALRVFTMKEAAELGAISMPGWHDPDVCPGGDHILPKGYGPLISQLQTNLTIRTKCVVKRVNTNKQRVQLETSQGTIQADRLLMTVPLGVYQSESIKWEPALPAYKRDAIHALGMGTLNKVVLRFSKAFWPQKAFFIGFEEKAALTPPLLVNMQRYTQAPLLMAVMGGTQGQDMESKTDKTIVEHIMHHLRKCFGTTVPHPNGHIVTRWKHDPFSRGSYSHVLAGSSPKAYEHMAEPIENRVFFAGEATSRRFPTTVHGAYLSGIREAKRILRL